MAFRDDNEALRAKLRSTQEALAKAEAENKRLLGVQVQAPSTAEPLSDSADRPPANPHFEQTVREFDGVLAESPAFDELTSDMIETFGAGTATVDGRRYRFVSGANHRVHVRPGTSGGTVLSVERRVSPPPPTLPLLVFFAAAGGLAAVLAPAFIGPVIMATGVAIAGVAAITFAHGFMKVEEVDATRRIEVAERKASEFLARHARLTTGGVRIEQAKATVEQEALPAIGHVKGDDFFENEV